MKANPWKVLWAIGRAGALLAVGTILGGCDLLNVVPVPPDRAPTGLRASLAEFDEEIRITWTAVERATAYRVLRAEAETGQFRLLDSTGGLVFVDRVGAENRGRLYWYKVQACNPAGCGPESAPVPGYAGWPPAPTNVQASDGTYSDRIVVTWDPVPGADYYQVFRDRAREGDYPVLPGAENVGTTSFVDTTAVAGLRYWYRVKACRNSPGGGSCSLLSAPDSGCRVPCPPGGTLDAAEGP